MNKNKSLFLFQQLFFFGSIAIIILACEYTFAQRCHNLGRDNDIAKMGSFMSQATTESRDIMQKAVIIANERVKRADSPSVLDQVTLSDIALALVATVEMRSLTMDVSQGTVFALLKQMDGLDSFRSTLRRQEDIGGLNIIESNRDEFVLKLTDNPYKSTNFSNVTLTEDAHLLLVKAEEAKDKENIYRRDTEQKDDFYNTHIAPDHILLAFINLPFSNPIRDFFFNSYSTSPTFTEILLGGFWDRFSPDIRRADAVNKMFYQNITIIRGENVRNGVRGESPRYQSVDYVSFYSQTQQQNTDLKSNIPFTKRITELPRLYPLDPQLYKNLANHLLDPANSTGVVITGPIGSGRRSLGSFVVEEILTIKRGQIMAQTMKLEFQQKENEKKSEENLNTADIETNVEVFYFDPSQIMTEGETKFVGVIPKNVKSFIESIENSLSHNSNQIITLRISDTPLNTLLNLGQTDKDNGTQLRDGLIRLMKQYEGRLKILGYTEPTTHRTFMDSPLGSHFRQVIKKPPNMEEIGTVLKFLIERRIEASHVGNISDREKEIIIESILHLYRTYNTYRLTYFKQLQVITDTVVQEIQAIKEADKQKDISPDQLDIIISRGFLNDQPFRNYMGHQRYYNIENAIQHVSETVIQNNNLVTNIVGNILFSSKKISKNVDDNARPLNITVLGGPSGTGKTILVRAIARWLHPGMTEPYFLLNGNQNEIALTKIIGEPSNPFKLEDTSADNASLTAYVRRYPYAIIYVNEFHRLSENIKNILETIFEDGKIDDAKGQTVSFEQTRWILDFNPVNKFDSSQIEANSIESLIKWIEDNNSRSFSDRLNKQMVFFIPELTKDQLADVARLMISSRGWTVEDDKIYNTIASHNKGARDIRDQISVLSIERERQLVDYVGENGIVPSNLRTGLILEDGKVRIIVE